MNQRLMCPLNANEEARIDPANANRRRVLHFVLDHRIGGPHVYVRTLLGAQGSAVSGCLVTAGRGPATDFAILNLRSANRLLYPLEVLINTVWIAMRFGLVDRPSILHVHGAANTAPLLAAFLVRLPLVWHLHETVLNQRALARVGTWLVRHTRHIVLTVARTGRAAYAQPEALLAPGAVDVEFWKRVAVRPDSKIAATGNIMRLVTVANLNPLKGLDVLLTALEQLKEPAHLTVVGAELTTHQNYAASLILQAKILCLKRPDITIDFVGSLPPIRIRELLLTADAFVLPSISEACPIALLEAMAVELPCVATDVGDVRDMLPTEQQVLICAPSDSTSLADALSHLFATSDEDRLRLGRANRQTAIARFSPAALAATVNKAYSKLLNVGNQSS